MKPDGLIITYIYGGWHPPRPQAPDAGFLSDDIWQFLLRCWAKIPEERVTIEDVCVFLRRAGESHHAPVEAVRA